jgi:hypothetical protein
VGKQNVSSVLKVPRHCPFVLISESIAGTIEVQFYGVGDRSLTGGVRANILKLPAGGPHVMHAEQSGIYTWMFPARSEGMHPGVRRRQPLAWHLNSEDYPLSMESLIGNCFV